MAAAATLPAALVAALAAPWLRPKAGLLLGAPDKLLLPMCRRLVPVLAAAVARNERTQGLPAAAAGAAAARYAGLIFIISAALCPIGPRADPTTLLVGAQAAAGAMEAMLGAGRCQQPLAGLGTLSDRLSSAQ